MSKTLKEKLELVKVKRSTDIIKQKLKDKKIFNYTPVEHQTGLTLFTTVWSDMREKKSE